MNVRNTLRYLTTHHETWERQKKVEQERLREYVEEERRLQHDRYLIQFRAYYETYGWPLKHVREEFEKRRRYERMTNKQKCDIERYLIDLEYPWCK